MYVITHIVVFLSGTIWIFKKRLVWCIWTIRCFTYLFLIVRNIYFQTFCLFPILMPDLLIELIYFIMIESV